MNAGSVVVVVVSGLFVVAFACIVRGFIQLARMFSAIDDHDEDGIV